MKTPAPGSQSLRIEVTDVDCEATAITHAALAAQQFFGHDNIEIIWASAPRTDSWELVKTTGGQTINVAASFSGTLIARTVEQ